ncbi:MAG: type VII secretion protein EccCa [Micrococcales bacterium]|nr:type VII secretion protein EccCa [Micrococcales bacterium]
MSMAGGREPIPEVPSGRIVMQPPPEITPSEGMSGLLMNAVPMLGSVGAMAFVAVGNPGPQGKIGAAMFLLSSLGFVGVNGWRQRKQHREGILEARREYLAYLQEVRGSIREAADRQREAALWKYPVPDALPTYVEEGSRVWERSVTDEDFLQVRIGRTNQPLCVELTPPDTPPMAQLDPVAASGLHRLLTTHRTQPDLPAAVWLPAFSRVEVTGDEAPVRALARSMVAAAAAQQSPDQLLVAVLASEETAAEWDWVKWLPHAMSPRERDAVGPSRMVATSMAELERLLPDDLRERPRFGRSQSPTLPHVLLVVDGGTVPAGNPIVTDDGVLGVTVLELPDKWGELYAPHRLRLALGQPFTSGSHKGEIPLQILTAGQEQARGVADQLSVIEAEATARRLAPRYAVAEPERRDALTGSTELTDLLGLGDVRDYDVQEAWRPRLKRDRLRVPIGVGAQGQAIALDIKESAQQGMGPHGLVIGATGSGKSELLRTLVLALAMTHDPEQLNFILVDFKGGATFAGMADMPHVSAVITNLGQELSLVDRMQDALQGEMNRRQEMLRAAGNFANVSDYEKARAAGADLEPLPALLIVADEFSELLSARPEFVELFVAIGRLGRSLQMHLLLSSQRLEEGRLRGLDSHLSYRIGLRTFSAAESRTVLGVPDAYELPAVPGLGYLKPDQNTMLQFKAAYVSGPPPRGPRTRAAVPGSPQQTEVLPFTAAPVERLRRESGEVVIDEGPVEERAVFDIAVARMRGKGRPAHQVWLPPLDVPDSLDTLLGDLTLDPQLGLVSGRWRSAGALTVPVGVVDLPLEQRRDVYTLNLSGAGGHVAIVGGPRSGKSTMARTLLASLALTRTPLEVQFYVMDFGGGSFTPFARLAHVAGVATRSEPDVVKRMFAEVRGIVDRRERYFRTHAIDSIETYRTRRARGEVDDGYGDVFLVIDGWGTVRAEFDDLEMQIQELAARALTYGVHLIVTAVRWMEIRTALRDVLGTRAELRLGDPADSEFDRKIAQNVPKGRPGRGIEPGKHHFLAGLPRLDGSGEVDTLGEGVEHLIDTVNAAWTGPRGPKLRLLPGHLGLADLRELAGTAYGPHGVLLGINEDDLAPIALDVREEPHLYFFGDSDSGKTAVLRTYAAEVQRLYTPAQAQVFLVDYRRTMLGEVPEDYLAGYFTTEDQAVEGLSGLAQFLRTRLPGPDVTPEQLRQRSWWTGADVFVLVDDYDLVVTSAGSPLMPLVPYLAQAGDVGLHVVLGRRSGGASRAMFEKTLQSLRDLAAPGLLLSGSPDEGTLIGNLKPRPAVPGRAQMLSRDHGRQVIQVAHAPSRHG